MKKQIKKLEKLAQNSDLKSDVVAWVKSQSESYDTLESVFSDLLHNGCVSGIVSHLIYYSDTTKFYESHHDEIWDLIEEKREDYGHSNALEFIASLNGAKNVGSEDQFKNLLAWFAFEETAYQLAIETGIEI